jgi:hypothetical protein
VPKRPESKDDQQADPGRSAEDTREALEFCFEDVSSLRMVGAAPLNDLYASAGSQRRPASSSSPAEGGRAGRWNLVLLALVVLTMIALTAAVLLR